MADEATPDKAPPPSGVSFSVEEEGGETTPKAPRALTPQRQASASAGSYDELLSRMSTDGARQGGQQLVAEELKNDVAKLNKRIKSMNRLLLDPRSKFMQIWDFFTLFALFFTLFVTPLEVALLPLELNGLFYFNWFINSIFICDMIFNFVLPYKESAKQGGGTVKSHKKIAGRYCKSWFWIDLVSILPFDSVEVVAIETGGASPFGDSAATLKIIKMIRLLRLLKLARILRASRIFSRWENELGMSYSNMALIQWMFITLCVVHILACAWALVAQLYGSLREQIQDDLEEAIKICRGMDGFDMANCLVPEFAGTCTGCVRESNGGDNITSDVCTDSDCLTPCEMQLYAVIQGPEDAFDYLGMNENWICRHQAGGAGFGGVVGTTVAELYFASLYVAILQVGGGVGSICPHNVAEYIYVTCALLLGSTAWALVVGTICGLVATGDPHTTEFKQKMDELNYFMKDMNITQGMRVRAREYFRQTRELRKKLTYSDLIERLSPTLRGEVVLQMSKKTLETVWYLRACQSDFLVELAMKMVREGYAPRERIPSEKLCIVMRGVAAKAGNILTYGDHWGEDMIVSSRALRDLRQASALTFVEVATISRDDLEEVLTQFPPSEREIRQSAMKIAMQRAIVVISEFVRMQQAAKTGRAAGLDKLAGVFSGGGSVDFGEDSATDPSMILNIITGGKLKDIDEEGNIVEEDEDEEVISPALKRQSTVAGLGGGGDMSSVLKELRDQRDEMRQSMSEMRREIADLKSKVGK